MPTLNTPEIGNDIDRVFKGPWARRAVEADHVGRRTGQSAVGSPDAKF
jgi:hypothetical protein